MPSLPPRSGYTLPVFACAAAIAALRQLQGERSFATVPVDLLEPAGVVEIAIAEVAELSSGSALAVTHSDPGDNLDLTRNTPIWALVEIRQAAAEQPATTSHLPVAPIQLEGGEGIGIKADGTPAIYSYARRLLLENLERWLMPGCAIRVRIILPEGRALAERTSNAAFGVVEGLSLLGTSGIAQPLSAPGQLEAFRHELHVKAQQFSCLVFCVGENGIDLATRSGIEPERIVKTANWLGSLLVEAGLQQVQEILLFGHHGKLIKLAGGIFHTHHYVADARLEILTAHSAIAGLSALDVQAVFGSKTTEAGLSYLKQLDAATQGQWVDRIYGTIAAAIDQRTQSYIHAHTGKTVQVGSVLFGKDRQFVVKSEQGTHLLQQIRQKCS